MKKGTKIALIAAACCIVLGLLLCGIAIATNGGSLTCITEPDLSESVPKTIVIDDAFHSIQIDDVPCDIRIVPASGDTCTVTYTDTDWMTHEIGVSDGTLTIKTEDTSDWTDHLFNITIEALSVTISLPENVLDKLDLSAVSGSIQVASGIEASVVNLSTTSGDIECFATVTDSLAASSTSGCVELDSIGRCEVSISTTSGDIFLARAHLESLSAGTSSGEIELESITIGGHMDLSSISGDIELENVDASSARISTTSGEVEGAILTPKRFLTETTSGEIRVQNTFDASEVWEVSTTSGDIELTIIP